MSTPLFGKRFSNPVDVVSPPEWKIQVNSIGGRVASRHSVEPSWMLLASGFSIKVLTWNAHKEHSCPTFVAEKFFSNEGRIIIRKIKMSWDEIGVLLCPVRLQFRIQ